MNETEKKLLGELARDIFKAKDTFFAKLASFGEIMESKNQPLPYSEEQVYNLFVGISRVALSVDKMVDML